MTVKELRALLEALPADQQNLPVFYENNAYGYCEFNGLASLCESETDRYAWGESILPRRILLD